MLMPTHRSCLVAALVALSGACEESPATRKSAPPETSSLVPAAGETVVAEPSEPGSANRPRFGVDSFSVAAVEASAGAGGEPTGPQPILPPYGLSTIHGDAIVGDDEECDDGDGGDDACTADCQTRDQGVLPLADSGAADRYQGAGRHPVAGLDAGFISTYVSVGDEEPSVGATVFDIWGKRSHVVDVGAGAFPTDEANPVAAALPGGRYAVAWSDFDGDGSDLGVALREVKADGALGALLTANGGREFSQLNPDMIWTGSQLVVAWEDYAEPLNGPDLRVRTFDAQLNATSGDVTLAGTELSEAAVALAPLASGWAAAYREGALTGQEYVVVVVGEQRFRVGPFVGGPIDDRPALVALDATHLIVAFSVQSDPSASGGYDVSRLRYAVVDTTGSLTPSSQSVDPIDDVYTRDSFNAQMSPALAAGPSGTFFLSWRSEARPGDAAGDQVWLRALRWNATASPALEAREAELLIPRTCEESVGDQRRPALARVGLPPYGALAVAWDDYSHAQGLGEPDVVVHYAPTHTQAAATGRVFDEPFSVSDGPGLTSHWSTVASNAALTATTLAEAARLAAPASVTGSLVSWVNHFSAINADLTVKVKPNDGGVAPGFVARLNDADSDTYLAVRFPSTTEPWRIFGALDGAEIAVATGVAPTMFNVYAPLVQHYLRFRVADNADGTLFVGAKTWVLGAAEPASWQMQATIPLVSTEQSTAQLAALGQRLSGRPGHFGLYSAFVTGNRYATFDDFHAKFFEGNQTGDLDAPIDAPLPLRRAAANYRTCSTDGRCEVAEGCCDTGDDCVAGLACSRAAGEAYGLGSHARTCVAGHCSNGKRDADEFRADCGGADCAPCDTCVSTKLPGQAGFCTPTCKGGVGDADCATADDCLPGLVCGQSRGPLFGWSPGFDVCLANHCYDYVQSGDETGPDCGGSCGSCDCAVADGCQAWCPCARGQGDCDYKVHCQAGLSCGSGVSFGQPFNVCVPDHCVNGTKDSALGETSVDLGGPCSADTGITLAEAMVDFPLLQYRKVSYGLETADHFALPVPTPPTGTLTTPTLKGTNRFIFYVPTTGDVSMTFNVGSIGGPATSAIDLKVYRAVGSLLKTLTVPSTNGQTVTTTVSLGTLSASTFYELDVAPRDANLSYTFTRSATIALSMRHGAAMTGPETPLYTFVPAEVDTAFLLGNFDPATPVRFFDPANVEVTPLQINSKLYALDTRGKPGVWKTSFRTTSARAHWVNLPDLFSFHADSVIAPKIIHTGFDYGSAPAVAATTHYLRGSNRFVFHLGTAGTPVFGLPIEGDPALGSMVLNVQTLDGVDVPGSPMSLGVASNQVNVGSLAAGDYLLDVVSHPSTWRYQVTAPVGVPLVSVDGFNSGNVWLATYRDYFYVRPGLSSVRFASTSATAIFTIYNPSGAAVAGQPVALGNNVYEVTTPTSGTWAMNIKGATIVRFLNSPQIMGFASSIQSTPLAGPPYACTSNANCPTNQVCGTDNGARFGRPATDDICWPPSCSAPPIGYCGSVLSPCGTCP